jgi:hypothetical protein
MVSISASVGGVVKEEFTVEGSQLTVRGDDGHGNLTVDCRQ